MELSVHPDSAQTIKNLASKEDQKFREIELRGYINTNHPKLAEDEILFGSSVLKIKELTQKTKEALNKILQAEPDHFKRKGHLSSNMNATAATLTIPQIKPHQLGHETMDVV